MTAWGTMMEKGFGGFTGDVDNLRELKKGGRRGGSFPVGDSIANGGR